MGNLVQTPNCGFTTFTYFLREATLGLLDSSYGIAVDAITTPPILTISTTASPVTYNMEWYATTTDTC